MLFAVFLLVPDSDKAFAVFKTYFHGIGDALPRPLLHRDPIHNHIDVVLHVALHLDIVVHVIERTIHPHPNKALALNVFEYFLIGTFTLPNHRGQKLDTGAFGKRHNRIYNRLGCLGNDDLAAFVTVRGANSGEEKTQIVVDFRHRAHGGSGVPVGRLLLDGDGRTQPFDVIHIGLIHLIKKLACIGRQALYITSLPFGVERVKGKTRLARSTESGNHHKLFSRDFQTEILEIMFPGTFNGDNVGGFFLLWGHPCTTLLGYVGQR